MSRSLTRRGKPPEESIFELEIGETAAGSVRLHFRPRRPLRSFYGHERELAAVIYFLAAELERRSGQVRATWAISPEPFNTRLDIEVADDREQGEAQAFLMRALAELGLDALVVG
ncbi:MAG: hypothetical protein SFX73_08355 [Kofleriaceae bacterium]|nr:hypothetical protein [Kofleriaceae bacterium]